MQKKVFGIVVLLLLVTIVGYQIYTLNSGEEPEKITTLKDITQKQKDKAVKPPKGYSEEIKFGIINTVVDDFDVKQVNLWSSTVQTRRHVGQVYHGDRVKVVESKGNYYLVESQNGIQGYCRKGFVVLE